jgi:uncharacterized protein YggT (Ycf19 family)
MSPWLLKVVTLLRLLSFMVLIYVGLAWIVERNSQRPDSKVRGFFRLLASPITRLVSRFLPAGTSYERLLAVTTAVVAGVWLVLVAVDMALPR